MFFHLFDGYTEVVHEFLGLFFLIGAILHIILNWNALKHHFKKGVFVPAAIAVGVISIMFIIQQQNNPKVDTIVLERIVKAPIEDVFKALQLDSSEAVKSLEEKNISIEGAATLEDIWMNNQVAPEKVLDLITDN